jgi:hypothetical protein
MPRRSLKSREPEDIRQTALRLREVDHQWLTAEARKHATTFNSEVVWRLLRSREQSVGVNLTTVIEGVVLRLEPYLAGANERDANNEIMLAARAMADVLAPLLAAGAIKGEAATQAAAAINRLNLARYNLESILGGNKVLVPGHPSWQALAEARFKDPEGKGLNAKEREAKKLYLEEGKEELFAKAPEIEEHGVKEPKANEPSGKESLR